MKDEKLLKLMALDVNPDHYQNKGKDTWEMMIDIYGEKAFINFCQCNAFKYRMRAGRKAGADIETDIKKAMWYEDKIRELENN